MSEQEVNIGLSNPKTPTNVGVVLRAVSCFSANTVYYTGDRYERAARFHTDTQNSAEKTEMKEVNCLLESIPEGNKVICIELVKGATPLTKFVHPEKAFYIFGPEDGSVDQEIVDRADEVVYIPTKGCLNVAMSVNIVLYDRLLKSNTSFNDDELISESRNFNNRLSVRKKSMPI